VTNTLQRLRYPERHAKSEVRALTERRVQREAEDQEILNRHLRDKDGQK